MLFDNKTILVTGGTGSMGKTFVRRVLSGKHGMAKKIIVLSRDEAKQHDMRMSYLNKSVSTDEVIYRNFMNTLEFRIGDVRDYGDVQAAIRGVDIVVNAAALKQVPTCEYFPAQAVMTNCMGVDNIVRAVAESSRPPAVVVGISTDKACKPVNVMGMTKALQERVFIAANVLSRHVRFVCVRYGNVLASRGSVIPVFHDQILNGGPITITDPHMTRFLLTLEQAVDTVLAAVEHAKPGETFIPRAPAATVENIAKALIGKRNIELRLIGIRPGEKLHEILVSDEEATRCGTAGNYYRIRPMLPELANIEDKEASPLAREYSSGDEVLDLPGTVALLKQNGLMYEDKPEFGTKEELLR